MPRRHREWSVYSNPDAGSERHDTAKKKTQEMRKKGADKAQDGTEPSEPAPAEKRPGQSASGATGIRARRETKLTVEGPSKDTICDSTKVIDTSFTFNFDALLAEQ